MFLLLTITIFTITIQAEIEKVKKRREERALEKARHEEEMASFFLIVCFLILNRYYEDIIYVALTMISLSLYCSTSGSVLLCSIPDILVKPESQTGV